MFKILEDVILIDDGGNIIEEPSKMAVNTDNIVAITPHLYEDPDDKSQWEECSIYLSDNKQIKIVTSLENLLKTLCNSKL